MGALYCVAMVNDEYRYNEFENIKYLTHDETLTDQELSCIGVNSFIDRENCIF